MHVYLDSNVLIEISDGRAPELAALLCRAADAGLYSFPFTAEQISEVTFGGNETRNAKRLQYLSRLSRDQYFVHSVYDHGFRTESPRSVYETLNEVVLGPGIERQLANMLSYHDQRNARASLGLDSSELNNLCPKDAIRRIDKALASYEYGPSTVDAVPRSLADFLSYAEKNTQEHFTKLWSQIGADPEYMAMSYKIVGLFSLFDSFGFWPDSRAVYEKGSRLADSRHAYNASYFSALVSRDRRFLNKCAAVYQFLGLSVIVNTTETFERALRKELAAS